MLVLVSGANGFTGSHLVRALLDVGHDVIAMIRSPSSDVSRLESLVKASNASLTFVYADIADRSAVFEAFASKSSQIDQVFHVAAYVELGLVDVDRMRGVNVEGTRNLLEASEAAGVSMFLYCSTVGIYGDSRGQLVDETFQRQQMTFSSAYDETKLRAQRLVDTAAKTNTTTRFVSVLPSGIFGSDDPHFGPVLRAFLSNRLYVWAGGDRVTGIVHVDDLVDLMIRASANSNPAGHFIAQTGEMTTRDMFALLSDEAGDVAPPRELPETLVRIVACLLDLIGRLFSWNPPISTERVHYLYDRCVRVKSDKARNQLGWRPRSVETVLRQIVREIRTEQQHGKCR